MFFFFFDEESGDMIPSDYSEATFEDIKHIDEDGSEFWYARELQQVLEYAAWRNFEKVIHKAKTACKMAGNVEKSHFVDIDKIVDAGVTTKPINDYKLSRYACYLIVQNSDPQKEVVALGQTYFAVKTRQQELIENYDNLTEDQRRLSIRAQMIEHNKSLVEAAHNAGIIESKDYAIFQNYGYQGLYGGLGAKEIHARKKLKKSQKILDYMGSEELAANLFRATQTDAKLRRENVQGKNAANQIHYEVGKTVRKTIAELGGTMPEDLPTPTKSIQTLHLEEEKRQMQLELNFDDTKTK